MNESLPPQRADRRQLQQIIAGLTEGVVFIDPNQCLIWANDAALEMHGVKDLEGLGGTVTGYRKQFKLRYRNNHPLSESDYPIDRLVAGEIFSDVIVQVRMTAVEELKWVHWVRSLVLTDSVGRPETLVLVIQDVTARFEAEERFERAFGANPAPAIICRLADLRYIKVNQGFEEMTGYDRDDLIGHSVYEIDVLQDAAQRELAIERLGEGRTIPQMEAALTLPDGSSKFVIVAGQPIEVGDEKCMLFTFIDLEERKKMEEALRHSEERFAKAFRLAPMPTILTSFDEFRVLDVNDAFLAETGHVAEEVIGRSAAELHLWGSTEVRKEIEQALKATGGVRNREVQMRNKAGEFIDCLLSAEIVTIHAKLCVLGILLDISERKRSELELLQAIETVMQDTSWFSRTVIERLADIRQPHATRQAKAELADLTPREQDILGLIAGGSDDAEIASELGLSRNTVRNHLSAIYGKIGVHRRSSAIVWARERGVVRGQKSLRSGPRPPRTRPSR